MDGTYNGWLEADSKHSMERAKERLGLNPKRAKRMMDLARTRGIRSEACKWSVDRAYLEGKETKGTEALAYNGYCFIMEKETMNCITLFPLPKDFGKKKTYYASGTSRKNEYAVTKEEWRSEMANVM